MGLVCWCLSRLASPAEEERKDEATDQADRADDEADSIHDAECGLLPLPILSGKENDDCFKV